LRKTQDKKKLQSQKRRNEFILYTSYPRVREDTRSLLQQQHFCEVIWLLGTFGIMSPIPSGPQPTGGSHYNFFHQPYCLAEENKIKLRRRIIIQRNCVRTNSRQNLSVSSNL